MSSGRLAINWDLVSAVPFVDLKGTSIDVPKNQAPWACGEVQLPDAIDVVTKRGGMNAISIYRERLRVDGGQPERHQAGLSWALNIKCSD